MMKNRKLLTVLACAIFAGFFAYWFVIALRDAQGDTNSAEIYSALYGIMALYGGVVGLFISKRWGGRKSLIGRAVLFTSLGLLAQEVGQLTYSAYTYLFNTEIPYPSWGDIGYFGSVIFYTLAAYSLVKAVGGGVAIRSKLGKILALTIPVLILAISYAVFLSGHTYDTSNALSVFLDFGYPLGQAFYLSLGILSFVLSAKYLGGFMRPVVLFLLFALTCQYAADFIFLYQTSRDTWQTAGINELMYLIAYFVMTIGLLEFARVHDHLSGSTSSK